VAICRAKNGELLTKKAQVLSRWKENFEQHLNEGEERDQPSVQVDPRDDGVEIDLPSREKIESALKYLKNNKAAGTDSITTELLKHGGPQLVDALEEVIQGKETYYRRLSSMSYWSQSCAEQNYKLTALYSTSKHKY
jgi:DNA primase large subunit